MPDKLPEVSEENTEQFCELAREQIQMQADHWDAIDQKNSILLAVYGIVAAVLAVGKVALLPAPWKETYLCVWIAFVAGGMTASLASIWPRDLDKPPNIAALHEHLAQSKQEFLQSELLDALEEAIIANQNAIDSKMRFLKFSIALCLPVALGMAIAAITLQVFGE
jgi:hypothetical protein